MKTSFVSTFRLAGAVALTTAGVCCAARPEPASSTSVAVTSAEYWHALRPAEDLAEVTRLLTRAYNEVDESLMVALEETAQRAAARHAEEAGATPAGRMHRILIEAKSSEEFTGLVLDEFEPFNAAGERGDDRVFFTGYFTPEYAASRTRTSRFRFPVYVPPRGFDTELADGDPWHSRSEIESRGLLRGNEIAWLTDPLDVYLIHVNGSARLRLPDQSTMCIALAGTNRREYTSLGRLMIERGLSTEAEMSMQKIRDVFREQPELVQSLMRRNDRYVFFRDADCSAWPRSAFGPRLTGMSAIASDKSCFPWGGIALVDFRAGDDANRTTTPRVTRLVVDIDTGGAIQGPGRADFYFGIGDRAGQLAGRTKSHGRLIYLLPRQSTTP